MTYFPECRSSKVSAICQVWSLELPHQANKRMQGLDFTTLTLNDSLDLHRNCTADRWHTTNE
ncbi:hypothetical protein WG66_007945 [Moniliophthora roreri]|nr:hypothetical protein WG66_007945 [Moniliophthora roreri]